MKNTDKVKRKISKTGILNYKGQKFYVRDKEFWNKTVDVLPNGREILVSYRSVDITSKASNFELFRWR